MRTYEEIRQYQKGWVEENLEYVRNYHKEYRLKNKEKIKVYQDEWKKKNSEKYKSYARNYFQANKRRIYKRIRLHLASDINAKLGVMLRQRLNKAMRGGYKAGSAVTDLGCSIPEFKAHIEAQFSGGMSWDNYGRRGWHIDHIKELNKFDLTDIEQLKQACHYTNLRPMWWLENVTRSNTK